MKIIKRLALLAGLVALVVIGYAQSTGTAATPSAVVVSPVPVPSSGAAAGGVTADNIVQWLTPIFVPLIIAGLKKIMPSIPGTFLPIIAPVLGVLADFINHFATGHSTNLIAAALLGLAGVGVREVKDQLAPAAPKPA